MIKFKRILLDNVNIPSIIKLFNQRGDIVTLKYYYDKTIKRKNIFILGKIISETNSEKDELILILREVLPNSCLRSLFFIRLTGNELEQYNENNLSEKDFLIFREITIEKTDGLNQMCEYEISFSKETTKIWFIPYKKDKLIFKSLNQLKSKNNNIYGIIRSISQGKLNAYNELPRESYVLFLQIYDHSNLIGVHLILKRNEDIPILEPNWIIRITNMKYINTGDNPEGLVDSAKTVTTFNTNQFPPQTSPSAIHLHDEELKIYCRLCEFLNQYLFMASSTNSENSSFSEHNLLPQNKIALRIKPFSHNMSHICASEIDHQNIIPDEFSVASPLRQDVLDIDHGHINDQDTDSNEEVQIPKDKSKYKNPEKKIIKKKKKLISKNNMYFLSSRENTINTTNTNHLMKNQMQNIHSSLVKEKEDGNKNKNKKTNNSPNIKRQIIIPNRVISIKERKNLDKEISNSRRSKRTIRENSNERFSDQSKNSERNDNNDPLTSTSSLSRKRKSPSNDEGINNCPQKTKLLDKNAKQVERTVLEKSPINYKLFKKTNYQSPSIKKFTPYRVQISPPRSLNFNPLGVSSPKYSSDSSIQNTSLNNGNDNCSIEQMEVNEELNKSDSTKTTIKERSQKEQIENENDNIEERSSLITADTTTREKIGLRQENYPYREENNCIGVFNPLANSSPRKEINTSTILYDDISIINDFSIIELNPIPYKIQKSSTDEEMKNEEVKDMVKTNYLDTKKIYRTLWERYKTCFNLYKSLESGLQAFNLDVKFVTDTNNTSEDNNHLLDYQTYIICSSCNYFEDSSSLKSHQQCSGKLEREYIIPLEIELKSRRTLTIFATSSFFDVSTEKFLENETEFNFQIKSKLKKLTTLSQSYISVKILRIWIKKQCLLIFGSKLKEYCI